MAHSAITFWRSQKNPDCPELRRAIAFRLRQAYAETGGVAQNGLILSEDGLPTITPVRGKFPLPQAEIPCPVRGKFPLITSDYLFLSPPQ